MSVFRGTDSGADRWKAQLSLLLHKTADVRNDQITEV